MSIPPKISHGSSRAAAIKSIVLGKIVDVIKSDFLDVIIVFLNKKYTILPWLQLTILIPGSLSNKRHYNALLLSGANVFPYAAVLAF